MDSYIGPLETLKKYQESHTRVKVFTRKKTGIRGFVTGYIELFDKHFNIALTDCFEKWKRRKYCFSENKVSHGEPQDCSEMLAKLGISLPETEVKSLNRKYVEISRKVPQLLIRGEQVVLITLDQEAEAEKETPS
jgi:small nuclear ribonucleoprotein (snRNP)-like protein